MGAVCLRNVYGNFHLFVSIRIEDIAAIAQLGERQTEDLKVPGSIPGLGNGVLHANNSCVVNAAVSSTGPE